ncbi:helix-turn-helix domain-containing protein [Paenibacillus sp. MBLB4367]|uniref:helix-turn-helix domain-containing protein n=1 Tax=Paenibacillus sp. MBLB4367 TaxID=3384767 RepID=UPI003907F8AB
MYVHDKMIAFDHRKTTYGTFKETFHAHKAMEFVYVYEGEGRLISEGQTYAIKPGTLLAFQPFQLHRVQMDVTETAPFVRTLLIFDEGLLTPYLEPYPALRSFFDHLVKDKLTVKTIEGLGAAELLVRQLDDCRQLIAEAAQQEKAEAHIHAVLTFLRLLKPIWLQAERNGDVYGQRTPHRAERIMQWLEAHYAEPFELERLAGELHASTYHLSHLFKDATGSTISDYLHATRVRHASMLLTHTSLSIPEIGERVGLTNPSYFCQLFKRKMGVSPHRYRLIQRKR